MDLHVASVWPRVSAPWIASSIVDFRPLSSSPGADARNHVHRTGHWYLQITRLVLFELGCNREAAHSLRRSRRPARCYRDGVTKYLWILAVGCATPAGTPSA